MKATITIKKEVEVKTLSVKAKVRYWEDASINGMEDTDGTLTPCRDGKCWCPEIDVDSGIITNWTKGTSAFIHFKVCDEGSYYLKDDSGEIVAKIEDDYVPRVMCPDKNGYGDYIIMNIDENGQIDKWNNNLFMYDFNL